MVVTTSLTRFWFDGECLPTFRPFPTSTQDQPEVVPRGEGDISGCYLCPYSFEPPQDPVHVQIPHERSLKYSPQVFEHATVVRAMMTPGPRRQTRMWLHPANGAWVKRTEAMQLIVQASPETIAVCRAERSRLASIGNECEAPFPLWKGDKIKYQDVMSKCKKTNHVFGTEYDDDWQQNFVLIDGAINPNGGDPIPLIDIPGDDEDTMRIAKAIRGNRYGYYDAEQVASEFVKKRRRVDVDADANSVK